MITDEELDNLSEDDELAFVQYESIVRASMEQARTNNSWDAERSYATHMVAFLDHRPIAFQYSRPPQAEEEFVDWFEEFQRAVDTYKISVRLKSSIRKKQNVAVLSLSQEFKTQIGGHLTAIRKIVFDADHLPLSKREALIRRINNLQEEVDRDRTRTEAAMALWLELTSAIGKGATNLDPAIERLGRIVKVLSLQKDENETKALEPPSKPKQISPPKQSKTEDDGIPF
ncbi:hypothetical protein [Bradyrhizobium sp. CCBAU 51765]|uniref:hypothetical protein n=1 Tax=Bradyrhizobium sp. CCBAU 51765 TaxID=1325102 RepID=UPI0018876F75|nr:hypothetical protein [Bradyrhizobium sp. CCBAU 51765]QOZ09236.1 hypothetical protein XH96_18140 [Bradyrhizobium sp. CCBAU 51765]